jgi:3-oxoacyl-[acyl-carrier protein] reductase
MSQEIPQRFADRTVMVTGAGTGYGAEIAVRAAQEGASTVVVHYRSSAAGAEQTADRVRDAGAGALLVQGDIVSWEDIKRMAQTVDAELGSLDALINNVGDMASEQESWKDITEELIDHTLAVDIKGTMLMIHEFGTRMLERGRGAIVNIGSTVIVRGSPRAPQYAAGKYGVLGLTKSYAKAFAPAVRVNTFAPGFMKTERVLNRPDWKGGRGEQLARDTPAGRIPEPEELAGTALFLASDEAAHITGTYMICDGGYSMLGA